MGLGQWRLGPWLPACLGAASEKANKEEPKQLWTIALKGDWSEQTLANLTALGQWLWSPGFCQTYAEDSAPMDIGEKWAFGKDHLEDALGMISEAEGFAGRYGTR